MNKQPFHLNIEKATLENKAYRYILYTGKYEQFVVMNIQPKDDIHMEIHEQTDQFIRIEKGKGKAIIDDKEYELSDGIGLIIPAGTHHRIINTSETDELKLYTIYAPPEHEDGKLQEFNPDKKGGSYYNKYIKYKNKYLKLKSM